MKRVICAVLLAVVASALYAFPFGLKMGMTVEEVQKESNGVPLVAIQGRKYAYVFEPAKRSSSFGTYFAMISDKVGLYSIMAIGNPIEMDDYGNQLKNEFIHILEQVSKNYGKPLVVDTLDPNSMWSEDKYWSMAFKEGARNLGACWPHSAEDKLPDGISKILLTTSSIRYKEAKVGLVYEFTNAVCVQDEEDNVF